MDYVKDMAFRFALENGFGRSPPASSRSSPSECCSVQSRK